MLIFVIIVFKIKTVCFIISCCKWAALITVRCRYGPGFGPVHLKGTPGLYEWDLDYTSSFSQEKWPHRKSDTDCFEFWRLLQEAGITRWKTEKSLSQFIAIFCFSFHSLAANCSCSSRFQLPLKISCCRRDATNTQKLLESGCNDSCSTLGGSISSRCLRPLTCPL